MNNLIKLKKVGRRTKVIFSFDDNDYMIGCFKLLKKFKRYDYDLQGNYKIKNVVEITATKEDIRGNNIKEFSLDEGVHSSIGEWIRTPGRMPGFSIETIDDAYYALEDYIINNIQEQEKKIVPAYGIFGKKGIFYTPNDYNVEGIEEEKNEEFKCFKTIFNNKIINKEDIKKDIEVLYDYLKEDQVNLFIFTYGYISLFRHYLFSKFGLEDFPFIGLLSSGTNRGKSARVRVLINGAFLNWTSKSFHSADVFKGSDERFFELNKINAPIGIEEIDYLPQNKISLLKQLATSSQIQNRIANIGGQGTYVRNFIRGGIVITANEINEIHSSLRDRFIILDLSEHEINEKKIEKQYNYLKRNINGICKYIWQNVNKDIDILNLKTEARKDAYFQIFENGLNLVNNLFEKFNLEKLELEIEKIINNKDEIILTDKIKKRKEIYFFIQKFTTYIEREGMTKKSIFDIQTLMKNPKKNKKIIEKILNEGWNSGILAGEEGILITKDFLNKMKNEKDTFFNIKKIYNLKEFFNKKNIRNYRTGNNDDLNYYDDYYYCDGIEPKKTKTGVMILNIWKENDEIKWED